MDVAVHVIIGRLTDIRQCQTQHIVVVKTNLTFLQVKQIVNRIDAVIKQKPLT